VPSSRTGDDLAFPVFPGLVRLQGLKSLQPRARMFRVATRARQRTPRAHQAEYRKAAADALTLPTVLPKDLVPDWRRGGSNAVGRVRGCRSARNAVGLIARPRYRVGGRERQRVTHKLVGIAKTRNCVPRCSVRSTNTVSKCAAGPGETPQVEQGARAARPGRSAFFAQGGGAKLVRGPHAG